MPYKEGEQIRFHLKWEDQNRWFVLNIYKQKSLFFILGDALIWKTASTTCYNRYLDTEMLATALTSLSPSHDQVNNAWPAPNSHWLLKFRPILMFKNDHLIQTIMLIYYAPHDIQTWSGSLYYKSQLVQTLLTSNIWQ